MKAKKTAFGKDSGYEKLAPIGMEIGFSKNKLAVKRHLKRMMNGSDIAAAQQSAYILHHCSDINHEIFRQYFPEMVSIIEKPLHNSCPRCILRIMAMSTIPEKYLGTIVGVCFNFLNNPDCAIAIKVFSMKIIANQLRVFPDLRNELTESISAQIDNSSAGFKSCARSIANDHKINCDW